jgi:hypothetical protein
MAAAGTFLPSPVVVLSVHRGYACRHAGACCTSGWTIPVEAPIFARLQEALAAGRLQSRAPVEDALQPFPAPASGYAGLLGHDAEGRCLFFDVDMDPGRGVWPDGGGCSIHGRLGHSTLPVACQQFPRVAVLRPGTTAVSLSHYCPTAAALLFDPPVPLRLEAGAPIAQGNAYEGLDVRAALPPLLRSNALFSWAGFDRWERFVVRTLTTAGEDAAAALAVIAEVAERVRAWTTSDGDFDVWAAAILEAAPPHPATRPFDPARVLESFQLVSASVAPALRVPAPQPSEVSVLPEIQRALHPFDAVVRRYLAARAWASWVAHESGGVRGYVRWLRLVHDVLRLEAARAAGTAACADRAWLSRAIQRADLLLVHLVTPARLAKCLAAADGTALDHPIARRGR